MRIRMQKDHIRTLKILRSMSEFGGERKHQDSAARTKSIRVFRLPKETWTHTIRKKNLPPRLSPIPALMTLYDVIRRAFPDDVCDVV